MNHTRRPSMPQLCAIARDVRARDATIGEWAEAVKVRIARLGFAYPRPHELTSALARVEAAMRRGRAA